MAIFRTYDLREQVLRIFIKFGRLRATGSSHLDLSNSHINDLTVLHCRLYAITSKLRKGHSLLEEKQIGYL